MANILIDGCWGNSNGKWTNGATATTAGAGRQAGQPAYVGGNSTNCDKTLDTNEPELIVGGALQVTNASLAGVLTGVGDTFLLILDSTAGSTQIDVRYNNLGQIVVTRNGTELWRSANNTVLAGRWYYVEVEVKIDPAAGYARVYLDEVLVPAISGAQSGINTRATVNSYVNRLIWRAPNGGGNKICDLYINTTSGAVAADNARWGDTRVDQLLLDGNDVVQGVSSGGGASTFGNLNDTSDTTYNELATGQKDKFTLANLVSSLGTVRALAVTPRWYKSDAGAATARVGLDSGGTEGAGATVTIGTTSATDARQQLFPTDPATGAGWLATAVNALKAFVEKVA